MKCGYVIYVMIESKSNELRIYGNKGRYTKFFFYLNKDISLNTAHKLLKFQMCISEIHIQ